MTMNGSSPLLSGPNSATPPGGGPAGATAPATAPATAAPRPDRQPAAAPASAPGAAPNATPSGGVAGWIIDMTEANFEQVVAGSQHYPVIVDLWATWCEPCKQLGPIIEEITTEYAGRFQLARVDIDANPAIAQAFQAQSVPFVVAIIAGQVVPLFAGAQPRQQVAAVIDQVLQIAAQNGITGTVPESASAPEQPAEPAIPPAHLEAMAAAEASDFATARDLWEKVIKNDPRDRAAQEALAQVNLMLRLDEAEAGAADSPTAIADQFMAQGNCAAAFRVLLDALRDAADTEREELRARLVELFAAAADRDAVAQARRELATLLMV